MSLPDAGGASAEPVVLPVDLLTEHVGASFGPGPPLSVAAEEVRRFREAVGSDRTDVTDDATDGGAVVPPSMVVALLPRFVADLYVVTGASLVVNYGLDGVRFAGQMRIGDVAVADARIATVEPRGAGYHVTVEVRVVAGDEDRSVICTAVMVGRFHRGWRS